MLDSQPTTPAPLPSNGQCVKDILAIAGPVLVTLLSFFLTEVMTIMFTGHLGDPAMLAGAGLGSM
jgi:Na+-driven multidrug efflux pump